MKSVPFTLAAVAAAGLICTAAVADELMMNAIGDEPANAPSGLPRPATGLRMGQVENRFGSPSERLAPVGTPGSIHQPPITRWIYPEYTVYFENDRVITSVLNR